MPYQQLTDTCLAETIGEGGLSSESLARNLEAAGPSLARLAVAAKDGSLPFLTLPGRRDDLSACAEASAGLRERCADVLILGTGGSSLGARALYGLVDRGFGPPPGTPRLHFVDNVDPDSLEALLASIDLTQAGVLAVSKSGETAETLAQVLVLLPRLEAAVGGGELGRRMAVITEPGNNPLAALAGRYDCMRLTQDADLGGRFSVLSAVGLVPAMIAGLDGEALRAGAEEVLNASLTAEKPDGSAPALGAAIAVGLLHERWVTQNVFMTYADRLAAFGLWYRQLWAESLGKNGTGITPVVARGAPDQHSQLQLYLAGPWDKLFTLVRLETAGQGPRMDPALAGGGPLSYLGGHTVGDLLHAMAEATAETLVRSGRPVRQFRLRELNEHAFGALLMHFMIETVIAADLLSVNAFDQPAVDESKRLARDYLQSTGRGEEAAS